MFPRRFYRSNTLRCTLLLYIIFFLFQCGISQKNGSIIPLTILNKTDTIEAGNKIIITDKESSPQIEFILHRREYFLVKGYVPNIKDKEIEHYIENYKNHEFMKYDSYEMIFVKETGDVNEAEINKNPEILNTSGFEVHKNIISIFDWERGEFNGFLKFENGKVTNKSKQ